jgi:hypothetical protein
MTPVVGHLEFTDGRLRPVYPDDRGQFVRGEQTALACTAFG